MTTCCKIRKYRKGWVCHSRKGLSWKLQEESGRSWLPALCPWVMYAQCSAAGTDAWGRSAASSFWGMLFHFKRLSWVIVETAYCKHSSAFCIFKCFTLTSISSLQFCLILVIVQVLHQSHELKHGTEERLLASWGFLSIFGMCLGWTFWVASGPRVEFIWVLYVMDIF